MPEERDVIAPIHSIRVRLLAAFVLLVLLPAAAIVLSLAIAGRNSMQERAIAQLDTVAESREAEIEAWIRTLQIKLATVLNTEDTRVHAPTLLQEETSSPMHLAAYQALQDQFQLWTVENPQFTELFLMDQRNVYLLLDEATRAGYITFQRAGDVYDLTFHYDNLTEVVDELTRQVQ